LTVFDPVELSFEERGKIIDWLENQKKEISCLGSIDKKFVTKLWIGRK
jgi:hypothetical protein